MYIIFASPSTPGTTNNYKRRKGSTGPVTLGAGVRAALVSLLIPRSKWRQRDFEDGLTVKCNDYSRLVIRSGFTPIFDTINNQLALGIANPASPSF